MGVNQILAGEWQLKSGKGFQQPRTEMLPKVAATVMTKGIGLYFDKTDGMYKIPSGDVGGIFAIVKIPPPLVADDPLGALRAECWIENGYVYTMIASEALLPWGYVKLANGGKVKKWVSGTDTIDECFGQFVQRPNVTPPQPSGKNLLAENGIDEVVGILKGAQPPY
jgi:hypothetical protein